MTAKKKAAKTTTDGGKIVTWLKANIKKYDTNASLRKACIAALGVHERPVYAAMARLRKKGVPIPSGSPATTTPKPASMTGRSLAEFRSTYDKDYIVPRKIAAGLKSLGAGWLYEMEFVKLCEVGLNDLATYREMFEENWHMCRKDNKRVWSGSKTTIATIKEMA